jgi:hypothetical protein
VFALSSSMKSKLILFIACLLFFLLGAPSAGYSVDSDTSNGTNTIIESPPQDIGDVVKLIQATPTMGITEVQSLLALIPTSMPVREYINRIDNITVNTVTDSVYNTPYLLPTTVTAYTNLGNTREVPVTWTQAEVPVIGVSTDQAGTYTLIGATPEFNQSFSFILTVTDADMYRIILTWGQHPSDLDSHLFGRNTEGEEDAFHIYYGNSIYQPGNETVAQLERDITDGYGPETTSIYFDGNTRTYKFGVHHYSGMGTLATSGASVNLYRGDTLLESYYVTTATTAQNTTTENARYWNIFELMNGSLTSINQLESELYYPGY